ncbi:MAG: CD225/dispanin family protein [Muribaculaceae bacterium]|nr:CD225/dispanin family protein [Muribaculaceae bacterium]
MENDKETAKDKQMEEWAGRLGMEYKRPEPPKWNPVREESAESDTPVTPEMPQSQQTPPPVNTNPPFRQPEANLNKREPMPPTYLLWAVLATICCCMPAGVVAIVFASSVSSRWFAGDIEGARKASRNAEIWIIVSIVLGIVWSAVYLPISLLLQ